MVFSLEYLARRAGLPAMLAGSALILQGCATGNPGVDALGNFFGSVLIAEAGAPKQNVTVNNQPVPQQFVHPAPENKWYFFLAEGFEDLNGDGLPQKGELRNVRGTTEGTFTYGQQQLFFMYNAALRFTDYSFDFYNEQGALFHRESNKLTTPANALHVFATTCPVGKYKASLLVNKEFIGQYSFTILPASP